MDREKVAKKLVELRGGRKREEVALAVGVTAQAIANYETGMRLPNDTLKVKIANYYNKSVQEIFFAD